MSTNPYGTGYVGGVGPSNPEIMFIGQSVGRQELESGVPFSGEAGTYFDEALDAAGIKRSDVYITNLLKYMPYRNAPKKLKDWEDHRSVENLWEEIAKINPQKIVALGGLPFHFLTGKTGITEHRGSVLRTQRLNKVIVGTFNPAHLLYQSEGGEVQGYWQKFLIDFDIKRAKTVSANFTPPQRHLWIARNSANVYEYFNRHAASKVASVDIEVLRCIPCCISFAFTKNEAISIPLFRTIDGIEVCTIPELDLNEIWRLLDRVLRNIAIDGQNFKFDQERLEQELCFKIGNFRSDTMLKAYVMQPELPKSQGFLTSIHTMEPYYKDEGKEFNPRRDKIDQFLLYNAKDSAVNREISDIQDQDLRDAGLYDYYYGYYHNLHRLYYDLELTGFDVDEQQRTKLIEKYTGQLNEVKRKLTDILGWTPKSVQGNAKDLALAVYEELKLPRRDSLDEESLVALSANHAKTKRQSDGIQCIIEWRRLEKVLGPDRLRFNIDHDRKARTSVRITGTETGRTSNAILKPPVRRYKTGLGFQTMSKHGDVGKDFRSMFIPPKGMVIINVDLSQADARVVALLAEDYDLLSLFDAIDIHKWTIAVGLDLPITKKYNTAALALANAATINPALAPITPEERFLGKGGRHATNYGATKRRFMIKTNTDAKKFHIPIQISEWKAGQLLDRIHAFSPKIRSVFHAKIEEALTNTRELIRPDGSPRMFFDRIGPDMFREAYADIPQHTVANQVKRAMLSMKKEIPELPIAVEAHDAFTFFWWEKEAEQVAKMAQEFMQRPIDFSRCSLKRGELIIPSDIEIGYNYADLKKKKFAA